MARMTGARARAGQLSAWPRRLPGRRARVRRQLDRFRRSRISDHVVWPAQGEVHGGASACAGQLAHTAVRVSWRVRAYFFIIIDKKM